MSVTSAAAVSQGLGTELIATPEWHSVSTRQHNAIFEGPEHATERLLLLLEPYLRTPAIWKRAPMATRTPYLRMRCTGVAQRMRVGPT